MSIAKFQFRLDQVLKQRVANEVSAEQALASACNEYNKRLTLLDNTRQCLKTALEASEQNETDLFEFRQFVFYRTSLNEKINDQKEDVRQAALIVAHKRDGVVQARQERQAIEKLKEQHLQNYNREMAQREQKEVDEMSLSAYTRRIN